MRGFGFRLFLEAKPKKKERKMPFRVAAFRGAPRRIAPKGPPNGPVVHAVFLFLVV